MLTRITHETGRPREIDTYTVLGLVLHWINGKLGQKHLQQIFGLTPATLSRYLKMGLDALEKCLEAHPSAKVVWPSPSQMKEYSATIQLKYPFVEETHIFGFADGTTFPVQNSSNVDEQNAFYSFTKSRTVINNVFCFTPDGCICHATINAPGSWHDANLAASGEGLYNKLLNNTPFPYKIVADQGFVDKRLSAKIACPLKDGQLLHGSLSQMRRQVGLHKYYTTVRQAAEWGMRGLKSSFGRLTVPLTTNTTIRHQLIRICVRMYNFRVRETGINQIATTYSALWQKDLFASHQHDRVARYYRVEICAEQ